MAHITRRDHRYWPRGVVHYTIRSDDFSQAQLNTLQTGIDHWSASTYFEFIRHDRDTVGRDTDHYIEFVIGKYANSSRSNHLGMDEPWCDIEFDGGRQRIVFDSGFTLGNVIHEIGHAIGFLHEHNRRDRNEHIEMHWDQIKRIGGRYFNMHRAPTSIQHGPYDHHSVMHYPAFARSRTLNYDIAGSATDIAFTIRGPGRRIATLYDARSGNFTRWHTDWASRLIDDPIEAGRFAEPVTDILYTTFSVGFRELRFNRDTGKLAIWELLEDGPSANTDPVIREYGPGPWAAPAVYAFGGAVNLILFHRERRQATHIVLQFRDRAVRPEPSGVTGPGLVDETTFDLDQDYSHVLYAQFGNAHRIFLFNEIDHSIAAYVAGVEGLGREVTAGGDPLRWPGLWSKPNLVPLGDGSVRVFGYERNLGRLVTFDLDRDGSWSNEMTQRDPPKNYTISAVVNAAGPKLTLMRQRDNRLIGRVYEMKSDNRELDGRMGNGNPSMTRRDDGTTRMGDGVFLTEGDIAAANFMVNRDLQIHDTRSLPDELGNRIHIERLEHGYRDALHFRTGPGHHLLYIPNRDGFPLIRRSFNRTTGELTDDIAEFDLGPVDHACVLYPEGRPMLFIVHRDGRLVRYPLNNGQIDIDRASEPETGFSSLSVLTGFDRDASFIIGYEREIRRAWVRKLRSPQSKYVFDGGLETFRLDGGIEDICAYRTRNRTYLVAVGDGKPTRFLRFFPRDRNFGEVEDAPNLGRNFNQVEVSGDGRVLYLYRAGSGRTEFWELDETGWPVSERVSGLEDRSGWTVMHAFANSVGQRLLFARDPEN